MRPLPPPRTKAAWARGTRRCFGGVAALLAFASALALFAPSARAADDPLLAPEHFEESIVGDDESLQSLYRFRQYVEENARRRTLALCQGYRFAYSIRAPVDHARRMISADESLQEWARVMGHGFMGPVASFYGNKAEFIRQAHLFSFGRFALFRSLYSTYLVRSMGFLDGAMHCLGTMDQSAINRFAYAIVMADAGAGGAGLVSMGELAGLGGSAIAAYVVRPLVWLFRPATALARILAARMSRSALLASGAATVAGAGWLANATIGRDIRAANQVQDFLNGGLTTSPRIERGIRVLRLRALAISMAAAYSPDGAEDDRLEALAQLREGLSQVTGAERTQWTARRAELEARGTGLVPDERAEYALLEVILPELPDPAR